MGFTPEEAMRELAAFNIIVDQAEDGLYDVVDTSGDVNSAYGLTAAELNEHTIAVLAAVYAW